jgi:hypothetical protein
MIMKHYVKPDAYLESLEMPHLLCDSLVSTSIEDFTDADQIDW